MDDANSNGRRFRENQHITDPFITLQTGANQNTLAPNWENIQGVP